MMRRLPLWASVAFLAASAAVLSACGGGGAAHAGGTLPASGSTPGSVAPQGSATATFALSLQQYTPVGTAANRRRAAYISPATAQISLTIISVNGVASTGSPLTFAVGPGAPNCSTVSGIVNCTLSATIPIGSDVLSASTLDANGHTLGTSTIAATVTQNATNRIALAVGGNIANLQLYLSQSQFTSGTPGTANMIVVPLDQSGAEIVNPGNYNPAITVTSSNSVSGHVSLITDGSNTGQSATIDSPNDQVVVNYDGVVTSGNATITASAGNGITASKNVSVGSPGLSASPSGAQYVTANAYVFTAANQTGTINVNGGTSPYTVTSSDTSLATISPSGSAPGPFTVTAVGYGAAGSATITVHDSAGGQTTIPVTFIAPPIVLTAGSCGGATCTAAGATYAIPATGQTTTLTPTTFTASGGTGTYAYYFTSSGTTTSSDAAAIEAGNAFTVTPSGFGNDALIISSGNQIVAYAINASPDGFALTLPTAIGMLVEAVGKNYSLALPSTVVNVVQTSGLMDDNFAFNSIGPSISARPMTAGPGNFAFTSSFGQTNVPFTVFGLTFSTYQGTGASSSSEQVTPGQLPGADEQFTAAGETDSVTVSGGSGTLLAASSNIGVVTASASGNVVTVTAVGPGTAAVTLTDGLPGGTLASAAYTASVTTTTIPIASTQRRP
jgi:hypothetical protein